MKLLEQVHGDEGQQTVFGGSDGVALVLFGYSFVFLLVGAVAGEHRPPLPADPLRGAVGVQVVLIRKAIRRGVPASLRVSSQQLSTAMLHPVEALHLRSRSCSQDRPPQNLPLCSTLMPPLLWRQKKQ